MQITATHPLRIKPIPILSDNYVWIVQGQRHVCVVDPGESVPVLDWLRTHHLSCDSILITHHHPDHTDGLLAMLAKYPMARIIGPHTLTGIINHHAFINASETTRIPSTNHSPEWLVLPCPGHTMDHVCYYTPGHLFSGDVLFKGGCGRLFEGTAAHMHHSLQSLLALPKDTLVYPAHEYTLSNLRFAQQCDPDNSILQDHLEQDSLKRQQHQCTLPTSIATELLINPFLRLRKPPIQNAMQLPTNASDVDIFAALRRAKDHFA